MKKVICILCILFFINAFSSFTFNDQTILNKIYKNEKIYTDIDSKKFVLRKSKGKSYQRTQIAGYKVIGNKIFVFLESKEADENGEVLDYNGNIGEFDYAVFEILKDKNIILKNKGEIEGFSLGIDIFTGDENMKFISVGDGTDGMEITVTFSKDSEHTNSTVFEFTPEKNKMIRLFSVAEHSYCSFLCKVGVDNYEFNKEKGKDNYDLKVETNNYIQDIVDTEHTPEKFLVSEKIIKYYTFEKGKYVLKKEDKSPKYLLSKSDEAVLGYLYDIYAWDADSSYEKYYVQQDMEDFGELFKTSPELKKDLVIKTYISHKEDIKDGLLITLKHILYKEEGKMNFDIANAKITEEYEEKVYFKKTAQDKWILEDIKNH
ncbi:hypothetical protein [Sebaldella sp. S0638]|uniref:hypothetical protein n=1 Tax=Sebaldella sp. S0638 TaxID=2957809 RepID=UPI00209F6358|nr:hypothetical protein [Sebaldella sp. S0638]MCP1223057.1 hypothetical protein [Sebaldella sp. S0638]